MIAHPERSTEQWTLMTRKVATSRARAVCNRHLNLRDHREDLAQEAFLELWIKFPQFDPKRAGWRTFAERVVANRLVSLLRSRFRFPIGQKLESGRLLCEVADNADLRIAVDQILGCLSPLDRRIGRSLRAYSVGEISLCLGVSRSTVYRSMHRLRAAFIAGGFTGVGCTRHRGQGVAQ